MNRLSTGIVLSAVFHLAILSWTYSSDLDKPSVTVTRGKTSVALKMKKSKPTSEQETPPKPEQKEVEQPEKKTVEPKKVKKPKPNATAPDPEPVEPEPEPKKVEKPESAKKPEEKSISSRKLTGAKRVKKTDYLNNPSPKYPPESKRRGDEGTVRLKVVVDESGQPLEVKVHQSSGYDRLDQAAVDTVKKWSFTPAKSGERAVTSTVLVPIKFDVKK